MFTRRTPHQYYFDHWARRYDRDLASFEYSVPEVMADVLPPYLSASPAILDIGIGTGLVAAALKQSMPQARISGVDISRRMLDICRARGIADDLRQCDAGSQILPYADETFDAVIATGVLEFIPGPAWLLTQVSQVLKPGGIFALAFEPIQSAPLYYPGILSGIIRNTPECATVRRLHYTPWPRIYNKYLHNPYLILQIADHLSFALKDRQSFLAYRRPNGDAVGHELLVWIRK